MTSMASKIRDKSCLMIGASALQSDRLIRREDIEQSVSSRFEKMADKHSGRIAAR